MPLYTNFEEINIDLEIRKQAKEHAISRTTEIVRQFVPRNAPLVHVESNYIGALGEIAVRKYLGLNINLENNYENHEVDKGDIVWDGLVYDVKTDAIPSSMFSRLYNGTIMPYDKYGCRVFTAKHLHHLPKYTGGLIFTAIEIPDNAKLTKEEDIIRDVIFNKDSLIIVGYVKQKDVTKNPPTWYTPQNPITKTVSKYNSPNYIFHHNDLTPIKILK